MKHVFLSLLVIGSSLADWCPPQPSARKGKCSSMSAALSAQSQPLSDEYAADTHLTMQALRFLFDRLANVFFIVIDTIELADETPGMETFVLLTFVESLRHFLCLLNYGPCWSHEAWNAQLDESCGLIQQACTALGSCAGEASLCSVITKDRGTSFAVLVSVIEHTEHVAKKIADNLRVATTKPIWQGGGDAKPCVPHYPLRLQHLNGTASERTPEHAKLSGRYRVLDILNHDTVPAESRFVVNLGAALVPGSPDSANCLVGHGSWPGVLLEVDRGRIEELRTEFGSRRDVYILSQMLRPSAFPTAVLDAVWNGRRALPAKGSLFPAFLKIDVDNGDCEYLSSWLETGYWPIAIEIEILQSWVPPQLDVSFPFEDVAFNASDSGNIKAEAQILRGCSLATVLSILRGEYSLLSWSYDVPVDATFVLTSWANEHQLTVVPPDGIPDFWLDVVSLRELWDDHRFHGLEIDPRMLVYEGMPMATKTKELQRSYDILKERLHV